MKNTLKRIFDMLKYSIPAIIIAAAILVALVPPIEVKADDTNAQQPEVTFAIVPSGYTHAEAFYGVDTSVEAPADPAPDAPSKITITGTSKHYLSVSALTGQNMYLGLIDIADEKHTTVYRATNGLNYYPSMVKNKNGNYEFKKNVLGMQYRYYVIDVESQLRSSQSKKYDVYIIPMMAGSNSATDQKSNIDGAVVTVAYPQAGGTTSGDKVSQESVTTTITANPNAGYRFDHWEYMRKDGNSEGEMKNAGSTQSMEVSVNGGYAAYVAIFTKISDDAGVYTKTVAGNGTTSGDTARVVNGQTVNSTTITATADDGYVFDYWDKERDGSAISTGEFKSTRPTLTVKVEDYKDVYRAHFIKEEDAGGVSTQVSAEGGGTTSGDTLRVVNGQLVSSTTITAYPNEGYVFDHWTKKVGSGSETDFSTTASVTVKVDDTKTVYTAYFKTNANGVATQQDDATHGTTSGDTLRYVNGQKVSSTTITAYPNEGYVFDHWTKKVGSGSETDFSTTASVTVKVDDTKTVYTAYFKENNYGVTTKAEPSEGGTTSGDTLRVVNGQKVNSTTIVAYPNDGYVLEYWSRKVGDGAETRFSTATSVTVRVDDTKTVYTAYFIKELECSGVTTQPDDESHGTTSGDTLRIVSGQKISSTTIVATAFAGYAFDHWTKERDGVLVSDFKSTSYSLAVKVEDHKDVYTAVFIEESSENGVFVQPDDEAHGTVSGDSPRTVNGQKVNQTTLQAFPSSNEWVFDYWTVTTPAVTDKRVSNSNPLSVEVKDERHIYTAHFRARNNVTKENVTINGKQTGVTSKIDKTKERTISSASLGVDKGTMVAKAGDAVDDSRSRLSSDTARNPVNVGVERLNTTLVVNEKKTSDNLKSENFRMLSADGEEIALKNAGSTGVKDAGKAAEEQVDKKYGSYYKAEVLLACDAQVPGGYADGKKTYVWSGTGAKKGERLMIIQQSSGGKDKVITPVADDEGTLTFSADSIGNSRLILVKAVTKK